VACRRQKKLKRGATHWEKGEKVGKNKRRNSGGSSKRTVQTEEKKKKKNPPNPQVQGAIH